MAPPIVTGIMAYGMSGRIFHAPFVSTHPGFKLKGVVERTKKIASTIYPDIISYNNIDELLNDAEIELIIVNTPNNLHFEHTKQALKAGKHVLLEKPAARTVAEVKELFELAQQAGRRLLLYQNRRYNSDFLSVKEVIESGRLGKLIEVSFRFDRYRAAISPKAFKEKASAGTNGLVYDLGPHLIDQAIHLFGKPLSFHKVTAAHREGSEVDDYFHIHLTYPNQLNVYLTSGLLMAQPQPGYIVHGALGSFVKDRTDVQEDQLDKGMMPTDFNFGIEPAGSEGQLTLIGPDGAKQMEQVENVKGDYNGIFDAVYQAIRHNAIYPVTEEHIAWQTEILQA